MRNHLSSRVNPFIDLLLLARSISAGFAARIVVSLCILQVFCVFLPLWAATTSQPPTFKIENPGYPDQTPTLGCACARDGDTLILGAFMPDSVAMTEAGVVCVYRQDGTGNWRLEAELTASDPTPIAGFGYSVAISGDTAIVGAFKDGGIRIEYGAAYVFARSGSTWTQQAKLTAPVRAQEDWFGWRVAVSGDTAVVTANRDDDAGTDSGAAYVFTRTGSVWTLQAQLALPDAAAGDRFGESLALSGDLLFLGANLDDGIATNTGSVSIFARTGSAWAEQDRLTASDPAKYDGFGTALAISEGAETLIVGTRNNSAYIFAYDGSTWTQQAKLSASDASASDSFGRSVAVSGDIAIVGAPDNDDAGWSSGSAYIFVRNGSIWTEQTKLAASDACDNDGFGVSVLGWGDTAIIGSVKACGAYVFSRVARDSEQIPDCEPDPTWKQTAKLTRPDYSVGYEGMGCSVAVSGDVAIVGARGDDSVRERSGSAYVFLRNGARWVEQARLMAPDAASFSAFGRAVAISGATAVVGMPFDNRGTEASDSGSVYVFSRTSSDWQLKAKLVAPQAVTDDCFGIAVAIQDDTLVVGAHCSVSYGTSGSAYVFTRAGSKWNLQARLVPSDAAIGDKFGRSVAILGNLVVVGAPENDDGGKSNCGSAYIFKRSGPQWTQQAKIVASDAAASGRFGSSVAIADNTIVVGAYPDDGSGTHDCGSVYVFAHTKSGWPQKAKLVSPDATDGDCFGRSVAVSGNKIVVGASPSGGWVTGEAYVFVRNSSTWDQGTKLLPPSRTTNDDLFGSSVAMSGGRVIVGAPETDYADKDSGAAYVIKLSPTVVFLTDGTPGATLNGPAIQAADAAGNCSAISATAPKNHRFRGWKMGNGADFSRDNPLTVTGVADDVTLTATFEEIPAAVKEWSLYE